MIRTVPGATMAWATAPATVLSLVPNLAHACPVCFTAKDENLLAFQLTTVLLTFVPLIMIGSIVYWLIRRARQIDREERTDDAPLQG